MSTLSRVFLQFAKGRANLPTEDEELKRLLEHAVDIGRRGRRFHLEAGLFVGYLAPRLSEASASAGVTLAQALEKMHLEDLYLACACMHHVPEAITELEDLHLAELRTWLKRTKSVVDEVCQSVRIQLLVGLTSAGPQLANYSGRGSLQNWIHVVASRLLPPREKPPPGGTPEDNLLDALGNIPCQRPDPETKLNKYHIEDAFRQALREAVAVLSRDQRRLLRLYYIDRLTTSELGRMIGKDQSTASRKLAEARKTVYEETRRLLQKSLQLASMELDSVLVAIGSSLDVSLSQILGETEEDEEE